MKYIMCKVKPVAHGSLELDYLHKLNLPSPQLSCGLLHFPLRYIFLYPFLYIEQTSMVFLLVLKSYKWEFKGNGFQ